MTNRPGLRLWELGNGRGTREPFPFTDHRSMAEDRVVKNVRRSKANRAKKRKRLPGRLTMLFGANSFL
jgi:hypothetical protein